MAPHPPLPVHLAADTVEALLAEGAGVGRTLYRVVLSLVAAGIVALAVIRVPVSIACEGAVRRAGEATQVRIPVSGLVASVHVRENQRVRRGDVVVTLHDPELRRRDRAAARRVEEGRLLVRDLETMRSSDPFAGGPTPRLYTPRLLAEFEHARLAYADQEQRVAHARRVTERAEALFDRQVASRAELELARATLERETSAADLLVRGFRREWEASLLAQREELGVREAEAAESRRLRALHRIVAPVDGVVQRLSAVAEGSLVQPGESVAAIAPASELVADVFLDPREIGRIRIGTPVKLTVDGGTERRVLHASVGEVPAHPVDATSGSPYRIRVPLAGVVPSADASAGEGLREGMRLRARFVLGNQRLWRRLLGGLRGRTVST